LKGLAALAIVVAVAVAGFAIYTFGWNGPTNPKQGATPTTPSSTVLRVDSLQTRFGPTYASIRQGAALQRARQVVISSEYGGDEPLFYRNTGDAAITQRARMGGHKAWLVRFEDNQVPKMSCVAVRRSASGVIAANQVRCSRQK
jgi:hypothetical protein